MDNFLERIKLIDNLFLELDIEQSEFIKRLKDNVNDGDTSMFFSQFDIFTSKKKEFVGHIGINTFKIRKRHKFFQTKANLAIAEGNIRHNGNQLKIDAKIKAFSGFLIFFLVFLLIFYSVFLTNMISSGGTLFMFPFIIIHGLLMIGIPYFILRRSVKQMKYDLEREFYFMSRSNYRYLN